MMDVEKPTPFVCQVWEGPWTGVKEHLVCEGVAEAAHFDRVLHEWAYRVLNLPMSLYPLGRWIKVGRRYRLLERKQGPVPEVSHA